MTPLRILVLVHPDLVPPAQVREEEILKAPWKMEYDVVTTLRYMGHEVDVLGVGDELDAIAARYEEFEPDLAFNLLEGFDDVRELDGHVVAHLELLGVPYTGCHPRGLMISRDKALTKKILAYHGIPCPGFVTYAPDEAIVAPEELGFPLIVKAVDQDASSGIAQASVVDSADALDDRVTFVHENLETIAIAEQFVPGRELYVGVLGGEELTTFPVWELSMRELPPSGRLVATEAVKFSDRYQEKYGIEWGPAELDTALADKLDELARRAFRALELSGYARVDFRVDAEGSAFVLEVNANPDIGYGSEFAESAHVGGIEYEELLARIVELGVVSTDGLGAE